MTWLLLPAIIVALFTLLAEIRNRQESDTQHKLGLWQRTALRLMLLLNSRPAYPAEYRQYSDESQDELCISFYVPREVIQIELKVSQLKNARIEAITLALGDDSWEAEYGLKHRAEPGPAGKLTLQFVGRRTFDLIRIKIDTGADNFEYSCTTRLHERYYRDAELLKDAANDLKDQHYRAALAKYERYLEFSDANPFVFSQLARLCSHFDKQDEAIEYALRYCATGTGEEPGNLYRSLIEEDLFVTADEIERLRQRRDEWQVTSRHGIIRLANQECFHLGLNERYFFSRRQLFVVERRAAGRRLTRLDFPLRGGCAILQTALHIIRADGGMERLTLERFSICDSPERNVFISLLHERQGTWTLPDLHAGDIVEMVYHTLNNCDGSQNCDPDFFILQALICPHPTLEYVSDWKMPAAAQVNLRVYNCASDFADIESSNDRYKLQRLQLHRLMPNAGLRSWFELAQRVPMIACASAGVEWQQVVEQGIARNVDSVMPTESLPREIAAAIKAGENVDAKLRLGFYWIRDCIKYGSHASGKSLIGNPDRGQLIVNARLGDCNDKAYLMMLLCRELDLKAQFVLVSLERGVILDDLPANQFDHILVRTRLDERRIYLDPTNNLATFDVLSPALQGVQGLLLSEDAEIVALPESKPAMNSVRIWENLTQRDQNWLRGDFRLEISGMIGRWADECFKEASMEADDLIRGASGVTQNFLPRQILLGFEKESDTSSSDVLRLSGHHCRCQLSRTGETATGILQWREPTLPLYHWRSQSIEDSFEFSLPLEIEINFEISGELHQSLVSLSEPLQFENSFCSITSLVSDEDTRLTLQRRIVVPHRRIASEDLALIPETLENLERALQLAILIKRE